MARELTVKEAKLAKAKAQGMTNVEAYKEAGYSRNSSETTMEANTRKVLARPPVQEAFREELARQGITVEAIIKPIADGLKAEKVSIVGNGEQAMAEVTPDHSIRLKSSQMAQTLMGVHKNSESAGGTFIQINNDMRSKYAD